jgi:glucokinase
VARDLALATAAWGGVFLTGGVVQGWSPLASARLFRASFEAGGKMQDRVRRIATAVIVRQDAAFLGLAHVPVG